VRIHKEGRQKLEAKQKPNDLHFAGNDHSLLGAASSAPTKILLPHAKNCSWFLHLITRDTARSLVQYC
jgi:hypothetical protein